MSKGRREVVLVGGGHSHVQLLRRHIMRPLADARLTLIVDHPVAVYSGMVPGFVAGQYARHELEIDVRPLARRAGARFVQARCTGVDTDAKRIELDGRPPLPYDLASLNVGSTVWGLDVPGVREHAIATRPIAAFVRRLPDRFAGLRDPDAPYDVVVVGAGAGGVELAACIATRLRTDGYADVRLTLVSREPPLPGRPSRLADRVVADLDARGVAFRRGEVVEVRPDGVVLADGTVLPSLATVWVPGAAAPAFLRDTGLPVDARGFVRVRDTLEVADTPDLFAAGDCAVPDGFPDIPKSGVYAVREGPALWRNLVRRLDGHPLERYRPQRDFLALLNYGDGTAVAAKWGLHVAGRPMFAYKDWLDRRFVRKFQVLGPDGRPEPAFARGMPPMPERDMVCGGCAAKVGPSALTRALGRLDPAPPDDSVLLGLGDDAAIVRTGEPTVWSVDAFPAFADDPWLVGRVAAVNALNDLWAKGAVPRHALAQVTVPADEDAEEALFQVLSGVRTTLDAVGVSLVGGHSTVGPELTVGLAVSGALSGPAWRLGGARVGDALVLTRALGTGVVLHADMAGAARGLWVSAAVAGMLRGARIAAEVARGFDVHAATDVTGFGLAIHLGQMLQASGAGAVVRLDAVPALPGALELLALGERSTFHAQNRDAARVTGTGPRVELVCDPQTAGGLLVATPSGDALVAALREAGEADATVIGEVVAGAGEVRWAIG